MQLLLKNKAATKRLADRKQRMLQQKCWSEKPVKPNVSIAQPIICPSCESGLPLHWECHYCLHCGFQLRSNYGQPPQETPMHQLGGPSERLDVGDIITVVIKINGKVLISKTTDDDFWVPMVRIGGLPFLHCAWELLTQLGLKGFCRTVIILRYTGAAVAFRSTNSHQMLWTYSIST